MCYHAVNRRFVSFFCFACHLQTVHPFPVIFISIPTEIISSFQRHAWFAKLMPCSSSFLPKHAYALHITSRIAWHVLHHVACSLHRDLLWFLCLCSCFGWSQEKSTCTRNPLSTLTRIKPSTTLRTLQARWPPLEITSIFALLVVRSIAMLRYLSLAISCLPYCHVKPLTILS